MSLVPFTGTITAAALKANFDAATATITSQMQLGQVDHAVVYRKGVLAAADAVQLRSVDFTAGDDYEARALRVLCTHTAAGRTVTATLTQTDGDTSVLMDTDITVSVASINGTAQASLDLRTTTGTRIMLFRGVRYRLTLSVDAATVDVGQVSLLLRTRRRRR